MPAYTTPPTEEDIRAMAEAALAAMPERLACHVRGVAILGGRAHRFAQLRIEDEQL